MKLNLAPKTKLGKWSLGLIVAMPALFFIGASLANSLYKSVPAGSTIWEDIAGRPALVLAMLLGMIAGILTFMVGIIAIIKQQERALLVYVATSTGMLLILFLIGEVLFPIKNWPLKRNLSEISLNYKI